MISQEINKEEEIEVLYNNSYSSWKISNKAKELYKLRRSTNKSTDNNSYLSRRSDPVLIQIYNELGEKFNELNSKTMIHKIPKKYEKYYYIDEYDGLESVQIDYTKYELDNLRKNIKEILENTTINNDEKINQFKKI